MKNRLNPKQAAVVKRVVEGQSQTQAYKEVYGVKNDDMAGTNASRLLGKDRVRNALQEALRKKGIDEGSIADTLIEMKKNKDWRAKESFVDRSSKFLGHGEQKLEELKVTRWRGE